MSKFNTFLKNNTQVTPENLKILYEELLLMRSSYYLDKYEEQNREVIQYIIEYLIYGDKHCSSIFDVFCEFNFMNEFIYLANMNHRAINLQIIKSFSVLILNLTNTTTLYYIFSNNFINQIISNDYEKYDDDFLSYFVNFIKSLSLKIDTTTIQFFFHRQLNSFPLLQSALKLYNHTDPMIKNVVRNTILTILKIKYDPIVDYFCTLPCITYFPFLSCRLRDLVIKLNEQIMIGSQESLKNVHDDIIDDILYLQDIFSLKLDKINYILINSLFYYTIMPLLCASLISMTKPVIAISVSIYMILNLFHYIRDESFLNTLFAVLFEDKLSKRMHLYMLDYPKNIRNYFFDWNSQKKASNYSTFTNYVTLNFSEPFIKSLLFQSNSQFSEVIALHKKYEKLAEEVNSSSANFFKHLIEDVLGRFSNSEFNNMTAYHRGVSIATGVNVGLVESDNKQECFLKNIEKVFLHKKGQISEDVLLVKNEIKENLFSYLKSKDDTLILLVSLLLFTLHKKPISKQLLSAARLNKANDLEKSEYDTNRILNELFSINYNSECESNERRGSEPSTDINQMSINTEEKVTNENPFDMADPQDIHLDSDFDSKVKIEEENFVLFYNNYFADLKQDSPKIYDSDLLDNLLNLLMVEPSFRTITNRLILENITSFLIKDNGFSFVERSQMDIINKIYYSYLSNIKLIILNNKYIRETGFELFENEWRTYRGEISLVVEELISRPYVLIPFNLEDEIEDYPRNLRLQNTEVENFKSFLIIFMTLHDLRAKIYRSNDLVKLSFPLKLGGFDLELDQSYDTSNIGIEIYSCKLKSASIKNFMNYLLLIYQNHIYFAQSDVKDPQFALIKNKYALRHLEAQIDRSDPRILNLIVKDKNNYIDLSLYFEDVNRTTSVKKSLEEQRKSFRNTEYLLLDSYFDDLISKWKF